MADADDRDFDAFVADHAAVRAAYRSASVGDEPAEALDAAILAASRRAVNAGPGRVRDSGRFTSRMAVPLAAAAVMVLATSLSFLVYEERGTPSAPESSRAVRAPAVGTTTADQADSGTDANAPAAPVGKAVEPPREASKAEERATARSRPVPMVTSPESSRSAPEGRVAAAPSLPSSSSSPSAAIPPTAVAVVPSEDVVDASAPRAQTLDAREEQASAAAARAGEMASERAAARNDVRDALRQAEVARAVSPGPGVDRATLARQAARRAEAVEAGAPEADSPGLSTSTARDGAVGANAKRLASPGQAPDAAGDMRDGVLPKAAPSVEETPAAWIARVRSLVDAGRMEDARTEVARLRCRYPDVTVPADLPAPAARADCPASPAKEGSPDLR